MGRPTPRNLDPELVDKCALETRKLFNTFLDIDDSYKETPEVGHFQRDSERPLRSGSFGSAASPDLLTRGGEDASLYTAQIERKRRSLRSSLSNSTPSINTLTTSTLETDSGHVLTRNLERDGAVQSNSRFTNMRRPMSGDLTKRSFVESPKSDFYFADEAVAQGPQPAASLAQRNPALPSEELLQEAARTIINVGDKIEKEYGDRMGSIKVKLERFMSENATSLSYEVFAATVNELVGTDRNWANLLLVMHVGKRVVSSSVSIGTNARSYFARFIGTAFGEEIARVGAADQYVRQHAHDPV